MNYRDDHVGPLFATGSEEEGRSRAYGSDEGFVVNQGTSEGAEVLMNSPG